LGLENRAFGVLWQGGAGLRHTILMSATISCPRAAKIFLRGIGRGFCGPCAS
jgi:hypothetical protein